MSGYVDVNLYIGNRKVGVTKLVIAAVLLFAAAVICVLVFIPGRGLLTVKQAQKMLTKERYIIHAGGFVEAPDGEMMSYTNSAEALENCYANGNRVSEFDFMITSDDRVICAHDSEEEGSWAEGIEGAGYGPKYPATYDDFMAAKFNGVLTTMSLDDLAAFMYDHPDFYVVTDVKDENIEVCRMIRERHPKLVNNFIIQIYHPDEYEKVKAIGFTYIIYTLYRATEDELTKESLLRTIDETDLTGITFWEDFPEQYPESFDALLGSGLPLFVHTVNDRDRMKTFIDMGISGIYTDVVNKEEQYM